MSDSVVFCATGADWENWLELHHAQESEVWLGMARKSTGEPSVSHHEALGTALCFGWIDGQTRSSGTPEGWWSQRFTPRRRRSTWSKVNCAWAEKLIAQGRMRPAGLAEVERARADGRWDRAYDSSRTAEPPPDLIEALAAIPGAAEAFAALSASARYHIIASLQKAVRPETRTRRLARHIAELDVDGTARTPVRRPAAVGSPPGPDQE